MYFRDTEIRNAVIGDFSPLLIRQDSGRLWENYIVSERVKRSHNAYGGKGFYFWKTYDKQEIDLIEEHVNTPEAFEIKGGKKRRTHPPPFKRHTPERHSTP
ncbi:MAG: DUF4143 domain-containing protein [Alloprevotella sp.]|nr:DUF4143 domain-containing protein [Alloprevotella sp.]